MPGESKKATSFLTWPFRNKLNAKLAYFIMNNCLVNLTSLYSIW
jgi:hypothetical protein